MKTIKFLILSLILFVIASCSKDDVGSNTEISGVTEEVYYEMVGDVQSIGLKEHYELLIQEASEGNDENDAHLLEYAISQLDAADEYEKECINQVGANWDTGVDGEEDCWVTDMPQFATNLSTIQVRMLCSQHLWCGLTTIFYLTLKPIIS